MIPFSVDIAQYPCKYYGGYSFVWYEDYFKQEHKIYISSAGLRVLLIMQKGTADGVKLGNVNDLVREILEQTGFDTLITVVE